MNAPLKKLSKSALSCLFNATLILAIVLVALSLYLLHRADLFVTHINQLVQVDIIEQLDDDVVQAVDLLKDGDDKITRIEILLEDIKRHPGVVIDPASLNALSQIQDQLHELTSAVNHIEQSGIAMSEQAVRLLSDEITNTLIEELRCQQGDVKPRSAQLSRDANNATKGQ